MKCVPILVAVVAIIAGLGLYNGRFIASGGRFLFSMFQGTLLATGQVGDGREQRVLQVYFW